MARADFASFRRAGQGWTDPNQEEFYLELWNSGIRQPIRFQIS